MSELPNHICNKEKEIDKLLHAIYGNGEAGIRTSLALIQQKLDSFPTANMLKFYMVIGGGLGVIGGLGLTSLLK